jgi:hypothetical protein
MVYGAELEINPPSEIFPRLYEAAASAIRRPPPISFHQLYYETSPLFISPFFGKTRQETPLSYPNHQ